MVRTRTFDWLAVVLLPTDTSSLLFFLLFIFTGPLYLRVKDCNPRMADIQNPGFELCLKKCIRSMQTSNWPTAETPCHTTCANWRKLEKLRRLPAFFSCRRCMSYHLRHLKKAGKIVKFCTNENGAIAFYDPAGKWRISEVKHKITCRPLQAKKISQ